MDSRTNPMAPDLVGVDTVDAEIRGEQEPLKMDEGGPSPLPGSLDVAEPDTSPTENSESDPGLVRGNRDPDSPGSLENDGHPEDANGDTPYDAAGSSGAEAAATA